MSWFDFFNKKYRYVTINGEQQWVRENDPKDVKEYNEFLANVKTNKGRFVKVYDDITFRELSLPEVEKLEKERSDIYVPVVESEVIVETKKPKKPIVKTKVVRKYKTRIPISKVIRESVLRRYNRVCAVCNNPADQIHHKDNNPSNNSLKNLELICYNCHKKKHRVRQ